MIFPKPDFITSVSLVFFLKKNLLFFEVANYQEVANIGATFGTPLQLFDSMRFDIRLVIS